MWYTKCEKIDFGDRAKQGGGGMVPLRSRGSRGRWRTVSKRSPKSMLWLVFSVLLVVSVITSFGYRRDSLIHGGYETNYEAQLPGRLNGEGGEFFRCDHSQFRTVICNLRGDIRMHNNSFVLYSKDPATTYKTEIIKPYTRKWEQSCMDTVQELPLRIVPATSPKFKPPPCNVHHTVPGVVFSNGGYTGNLYHDFNDGLIPLFITTQHLHRNVVFVIMEFHHWWLTKYTELLHELSSHELVNFHNDTRVHCFQELEAGLHIHDELAVDPARLPDRATIQEFRNTLNRAYTSALGVELAAPTPPTLKLTIIFRNDTRKLLNLEAIVAIASELGFNVEILSPDRYTELKYVFRVLNKTDVLLGVHGAAMTHLLFMRPGTVLIQVIPLGTDWAARTYYGNPAKKLGMHYFPLKITPAESTLSEKYNTSDPILRRPNEVYKKQGWSGMKAIYLEGQDVRPSLTRMRATLRRALANLEKKKRLQHSS